MSGTWLFFFSHRLEWALEPTQEFWAVITWYWWPCILPPSLYTWRWRKKYKLLLQEMFPWFISSPPPSWGSEWFLSSQLLCLWSKCPRQWELAALAFLAEPSAFLFGTVGRTCGSMGFAQANVAWQWKGLQRLKGPSSPGILGLSCPSSSGN